MSKIMANPSPLPPPASNADLIKALDGLRHALDEFSNRTTSNLQWLTEGLQARLDAADRRK
jgi:hypothetical protein